jgi:RHS repeat-associated protein
VTSIRDHAQQTVFFANTQVEPHGDYVYDALYRLVEARGREHAAQNASQRDAGDFTTIVGIPFPNSPEALQRYHERYDYDGVGNILSMRHVGGEIERWTRRYRYAGEGNRLLATSEAGDGANAFSSPYSYDAHGNMTRMPHLPVMRWDFRDRLQASSGQVVNDGVPDTTFYVYDAAGQRVRKVTESGATEARRHERLYVGGFEIYREFTADGSAVTLERQTLHLNDAGRRITQIDTRTVGVDDGPVQSRRFVLGNHLGSAVLEIDERADVVFYEEHHPYGTVAYAATRSAAEVRLKRYRYAGKERDEETGLYYHGARYCAAWLGRWTSTDPIGIADGGNRYQFTRSNPVTLVDPTGLATKLAELTSNLKSDIASAVKTAKKHVVKAVKAGKKSVKKAIAKAQKKGVTASLFEVVTYGVDILNRSQLGKRVQQDHIIAQGKERLIFTDYEGNFRHDPNKDPTVVVETGKATDTEPAKPHTKKTYHVDTADTKEIARLQDKGIGHFADDIILPSRQAALDAGYPEHAVNKAILEQVSGFFSNQTLAETNAELRRIEANGGPPPKNGGPPPKKGPSGGKGGLSKGNVLAAVAVGGFAALSVAAQGGSAEDAAVAAHDTINPAAETTKAFVRGEDLGDAVMADVWNLTAGAMIEQAKFSAKLGVSAAGGLPIVVANEASNFFTGQNLWEHL